jgi:HD-GYP domain-containing protein (c-di-GMP phosphodiesterase class II)
MEWSAETMLPKAQAYCRALDLPAEGRDALEALTNHHPPTARHSQLVAYLVSRLFEEGLWTASDYRETVLAALLHDVGKVVLPRSVLEARTRPADAVLALHARHGAKLLANHPTLAEIVSQIHERPDGLGYPAGLTLEQIHPAAALIAVVDSFEALTSPERAYRDPQDPVDAFAFLTNGANVAYRLEPLMALGRLLGFWDR